jgi:hypothetical protein
MMHEPANRSKVKRTKQRPFQGVALKQDEQVKKSGVAGVQELQNEMAAFRSVDSD